MTARPWVFPAPVLLLLALAACAHAPRREVLSAASERRCEDAFYFFSVRPPPSAADEARRVLTTPLSWAFTVVGYGADAALRVAGGVGAGAMVCMPVAMLEGALRSDGELTGRCFFGVVGAVATSDLPSAGRGISRSTRTWRCPDLAPIAREARAVAGCYAARRMPDDDERARAVLLSIREARRIWECLPSTEQRAVEGSLAALPPSPAIPADDAPPPQDEPAAIAPAPADAP